MEEYKQQEVSPDLNHKVLSFSSEINICRIVVCHIRKQTMQMKSIITNIKLFQVSCLQTRWPRSNTAQPQHQVLLLEFVFLL